MLCLAVKDASGGSWGRRAARGQGIAVTCCYCRAGGELVKFAAGFPHPCSRDWHCIPGASDSAFSPFGLDCQHCIFIISDTTDYKVILLKAAIQRNLPPPSAIL